MRGGLLLTRHADHQTTQHPRNKGTRPAQHHRERHRPSGFAFALADRIDFLDKTHWEKVTSHDSLFLSPRYLRVLEDAGPDNLRQCYALIFKDKETRRRGSRAVCDCFSRTPSQEVVEEHSSSMDSKKRCSSAATFFLGHARHLVRAERGP